MDSVCGGAAESMMLIDAYSQIFRAFFAIRMLTNPRGEPVNAAYGFTKLLLKLEKECPSPAGAMLFDCGRVDFRSEILPGYKANRPPMPEELRRQIPLIREIAAAFGWPLFQHQNWEADDLIGGLVRRFPGYRVRIVSADKDLSQLVDDRVEMLVPFSSGFERRGREEVRKKFGVPPELMVDYLALLGDASDNIPGIAGIGPKSAADLLNTFGPAEQWLHAPEKLAGSRYFLKIRPYLDVLEQNRKLIQLRTRWPEDIPLTEAPRRETPDWRRIAELCRDNRFASILKELPAPTAPDADAGDDLFAFAVARNVPDAEPEVAAEHPVQSELF
ncbi:MAG: hypothetical protein MR051_00320 [Lentisphaeria bacterium]|nr:hypothetical protein [Lentisphaeria bacterium]